MTGAPNCFHVKRFVEKPDAPRARRYLKSRDFFWNGGIFTWRLGVYQRSMKHTCPEFFRNFDSARLRQSYRKLPNISVDFALMEKADNIALCRALMDWCDLGDLDMFYEQSPRKKSSNRADGFSYRKDVNGSLIMNQTQQPLVAVGVSGLIIVQTSRGTLICQKGRAQEAALFFKKV